MWTEEEVKEVLGQQAPMFMSHYYIKAQGNADLSPRSDPHHEFGGLNCLRQAQTLQETARQVGVGEEEARQTLATCRQKLHERREKRPRPHLDDKVEHLYKMLACFESHAAKLKSNIGGIIRTRCWLLQSMTAEEQDCWYSESRQLPH